MFRFAFTAVAALALAVPACLAGEPAIGGLTIGGLTIGDQAPAIDIAHWVKGEKVGAFEDDKVYVVEFWATWCGPCRASMPHISEMQAKYRDYDVTFIGVSDEPLQQVVKFLFESDTRDNKVNNDRIGYTLTTDPDMSVKKDYFHAAGQRRIPCAFIVGKDQRIEWIGHPMKIDQPLDAVVRETWDRAAFKTNFETARSDEKTAEKYFNAYREASAESRWEDAVAALDQLAKLGPDYERMNVRKLMILSKELGRYDEAYAFGAELTEAHWDDHGTLNQIAWFIVDPAEDLAERDLDLAMRAATRACELTNHADGAILDTLARVHYRAGALDKAIEVQREAVKHAQAQMAADLKRVLAQYESESGL